MRCLADGCTLGDNGRHVGPGCGCPCHGPDGGKIPKDKTLDTVTAAEWRSASEKERREFIAGFLAKGIGSFCCLTCGFPTEHGQYCCESCE